MSIKKCISCEEIKELNEFYIQNKKKKDGTLYTYYPPECKECTKKRSMKWEKDNPEKRRRIIKKQNSKETNKIKIKELNEISRQEGRYLEWLRSNKDKVRRYNENRNNNKKHTISEEDWNTCKEYFNWECAYCGLHEDYHFKKYLGEYRKYDLHKEHVVHTGLNDITNCVPSCHSCNSSKNTSSLNTWYTSDKSFYTNERLSIINKWLNEVAPKLC